MYAAWMPTNALTPYGMMDYSTNSLERSQNYTGYSYINGTEHPKRKSDGQENSAKHSASRRECVREASSHQDYSVSSLMTFYSNSNPTPAA